MQGLRDFTAVAAARQEHSIPILNQFKAWMDRELESGHVLPESSIAKAIGYALNSGMSCVPSLPMAAYRLIATSPSVNFDR